MITTMRVFEVLYPCRHQHAASIQQRLLQQCWLEQRQEMVLAVVELSAVTAEFGIDVAIQNQTWMMELVNAPVLKRRGARLAA